MDIVSIVGFVVAAGSIAYGYTMDGGLLQALWMTSAFIITCGGALGAVLLSSGFSQVKQLPKLMMEVFIKPKSTVGKTIEQLVFMSKTARQNGLLSLEKAVTEGDGKNRIDPFLKRGILMVVDGTDPEKINDILQNDIYVYEQNKGINISMFEAMGTFAPAFGMIGTIVGLIQLLSAGMDDPAALTKAIGVAFITTLYGSLLANCFFLPAATKLRSRLSVYRLEKEMIIEAVCAIRNGVNPRLLEEQLSSYLVLAPGSQARKGKAALSQGEKAAAASGR
jgi:chemotaxis protein MotA